MATPPKCGPQDMPPAGGYQPLQWERVKLRRVFGNAATIGLFFAANAYGLAGYWYSLKKQKREKFEMLSACFACLPMLIAERDRSFLKQLHINRDAEKELMKNVPEWKVGTYFGEPVYITQGDKFIEPHYLEFMAHADYHDITYRLIRRLLY